MKPVKPRIKGSPQKLPPGVSAQNSIKWGDPLYMVVRIGGRYTCEFEGLRVGITLREGRRAP